jgi:hypothetical protein
MPDAGSLGMQSLFRVLYPSPGCAIMAPSFELAYREALGHFTAPDRQPRLRRPDASRDRRDTGAVTQGRTDY